MDGVVLMRYKLTDAVLSLNVHVYCTYTLLDETTALEKAVPADKLRAMLQTQLEYYFSA